MGSNLCAPFFYNSILPDLSFSASSYDSKLQWEIAVGDSKKSIVSALTLDEDLRQLSGRPMNQKSFFVDPDKPENGNLSSDRGVLSHWATTELRPTSNTEEKE